MNAAAAIAERDKKHSVLAVVDAKLHTSAPGVLKGVSGDLGDRRRNARLVLRVELQRSRNRARFLAHQDYIIFGSHVDGDQIWHDSNIRVLTYPITELTSCSFGDEHRYIVAAATEVSVQDRRNHAGVFVQNPGIFLQVPARC